MPDVFGIVLAGGEGKRLAPADRRPRQARRAVRRQLPADRLRALEPRQRRTTARSSCSRSTRATRSTATSRRPGGCRRCWATTSRRCRRRCAAARAGSSGSADAIYQNFNLIHDERPELHHRLRRRPHLPHGPAPDGRPAHRVAAPAVTVAALRAPIEQADQFGVIETAADGRDDRRLPREADRRRSGCPTRPTRSTPRWATTSSPPRR